MMIGTVDKVEFTNGSPFGNQWTTIDGTRYATWWDIRAHKVHVGVTVEYEIAPDQECYVGNGATLVCRPCARIVRVIDPR